jgi:hypothetical protein
MISNISLIIIIILLLIFIISFLITHTFLNNTNKEPFVSKYIPKGYEHEIEYKLQNYFTNPPNNIINFLTSDDKYRCAFKTAKASNNVPFQRTIVPKELNTVYEIDTTKCSNSIDPERCNQNKDYNIKYQRFYENVPNVNYDISRNKVFLETSISNEAVNYSDLSMVTYLNVSPTYETTYDVCKPMDKKYDPAHGLDANFPCGALLCEENTLMSKEDDEDISEERMMCAMPEYDELNKRLTLMHHDVLEQEHQSKIDGILSSLGFTTWIKELSMIQDKNRKVFDKPYIE